MIVCFMAKKQTKQTNKLLDTAAELLFVYFSRSYCNFCCVSEQLDSKVSIYYNNLRNGSRYQ